MSEGNGYAPDEIRAAMLERFGRKIEEVDVAGEPVRVRTLMAGEGMGLLGLKGYDLMRRAALLCVCDEEGRRVFRDEDEDAIGDSLVFAAGSEALKINGLLDLEGVRGKSEETPAGSSPSG